MPPMSAIADLAQLVEVARDGPPHALEPRLVVAGQPFVGLPQRSHQRLGAAAQQALLLRHPQRRLDLDGDVLVT